MTILENGVAVVGGDTHIGEWAKQKGLNYDPWFNHEVCKRLLPGDLAIDVGANIGSVTRAMLDVGANVIAFQPNREVVECLYHNCPEAVIYQCGLGDEDCMATIHNSPNVGASYLEKAGEYDSVQIRSLDDYHFAPKLIKIDAEGFELKVMYGAMRTIVKYKPVLIIKVNRGALVRAGDTPERLISLLVALNYSWTILEPQGQSMDPQFNIVCLP